MKAVVVHKPGDIRYESVPLPVPGPGQVCVEVRAVAICSSDVARALHGQAYSYPIVLGHEIAGVVSALGDGVTDLRPGDRVAIAPLIPCWQCEWCARGRYSLCEQYDYLGSRCAGGYAEFVVVPVANLVPLPPEVSDDAGTLVEPAAVVLHGLQQVEIGLGDTVAIVGLGPLGLLAVQSCRLLGATRILASDLSPARLEMAERSGAEVYPGGPGLDAASAIRQATDGRGVDVVVEAAGVPEAVTNGAAMVCRGGRVLCTGVLHKDVCFSSTQWQRVVRHELRVCGAWNSYGVPFPGSAWRAAVRYLSTGALQAENLISHRFSLSKAGDALRMMDTDRETSLKIILHPGGE